MPPATAAADVVLTQADGSLLRLEGPAQRIVALSPHLAEGLYAAEHNLDLADLPVDHVKQVLWTYRERLSDLVKDRRFKYILIFKNHGSAAGASLSHPHTQLIATPVTPLTMDEELMSAKAHYQVKERCLFCDVIQQELEVGEIVTLEDRFVALAPFAPRFPFEIFLAPRHHHHSFADADDDMLITSPSC